MSEGACVRACNGESERKSNQLGSGGGVGHDQGGAPRSQQPLGNSAFFQGFIGISVPKAHSASTSLGDFANLRVGSSTCAEMTTGMGMAASSGGAGRGDVSTGVRITTSSNSLKEEAWCCYNPRKSVTMSANIVLGEMDSIYLSLLSTDRRRIRAQCRPADRSRTTFAVPRDPKATLRQETLPRNFSLYRFTQLYCRS